MQETQLKKAPYEAPTIEVDIIEIENSIATSSSQGQVTGGTTGTNQPDVEEWKEETINHDFEI